MAIHARDKGSNNPRLQCAVCGRWMRVHRKDGTQSFYGGCSHNQGNDHLAAPMDVCVECCDRECRRLAATTAA